MLPPGPGLATQLKLIPRAPLLPSVPSSWTNSSASGACNQLVTRRKGWERNTKDNSWASRIGRDLLRAMWLTATQHLHLCVSKLCQKHPYHRLHIWNWLLSPHLTICTSRDVLYFKNNLTCIAALSNVGVFPPHSPVVSGLRIQTKCGFFRSFNFVLIWFISAAWGVVNSPHSLYSACFSFSFFLKKVDVKCMNQTPETLLQRLLSMHEKGNQILEGKAVIMAAEIISDWDLLFRCFFYVSYFNL